ncbi:MFS transporter [Levilactobacillus namurensis]|uniref:MFS transporter n=1 Tax=Levilactobacillus namurensis TaxID=380393 RepID=UPI00222FFFA5|nr:MFS transporter [Levilactobacillus namurensis]MCW3778858.1 MFS transporter [Levilactobacillus namurensis]MDT7017847.1 MFS transporter [Levilactobacillus namurensis]WNN65153.1 MFS transporter [Levilactobacillus namurensis]
MDVKSNIDQKLLPWQTPNDAQQKKFPVRTAIALGVGVVLWLGPYLALVGVLVPQQVAKINPGQKTEIIALMSTCAMIVSTIANIVEGALSDRTRSRWGRRTPWIVLGSVGTAICILFWGKSVTAWQVILSDSIYMIFLNMIVAPLIAVIADRTSPKYRGTISSVYALGSAAGQYGGQAFASLFLPVPYTGFIVMAVLTLFSGPLAAIILREKSTKDMPVEKVTIKNFSQNFAFPTKGAMDFYLALFGKLAIQTASFAISGYQLYILTDYIKLHGGKLQSYVTLISMILMVTAIVLCIFAGPLSDKIGKRKVPVIFAGGLIAVGSLVPMFSTKPWVMLAYAAIVGIGMGMYNSVDQALNIEVLPDPKTAAKDLGLLNMANNGGQVFGPIFSAAIIGIVGYRGIFPLACAMAVIGSVLIIFIKKVK